MLLYKEIFRRYDIRGIYGEKLTAELGKNAAKAFASQLIRECGKSDPVLSVGRDMRFSSEELFHAVCSGLTESGINVVDNGICPSPLTYFSMYQDKTDGYMMITGSHNPPEFNGIKVGTKNTVYHSEKIQQIYTDIVNQNYPHPYRKGVITKTDIKKKYIDYMLKHFSGLRQDLLSLGRPIRLVIDCGSGTASDIAPDFFELLGAEVYRLYCRADGSFPGHHPDPTVEKNLSEAKEILLKESADMCFGYDGDADRLGVLDSSGQMMWGDQLICIFASAIADSHQGEKVIADVKSSQGLYEHIRNIGMEPVMFLSGHSMIKEKMKLEKAVLGGEMSSHFFFADRYFGYDDGIYASARLLEAYVSALKSGKVKNSCELTADIPKYINTPEIREPFPDSRKFLLIDNLSEILNIYKKENKFGIVDIADMDGVRISFEKGWALVRASNTEPLLVTRYEAVNPEELEKIRKFIKSEINKLAVN